LVIVLQVVKVIDLDIQRQLGSTHLTIGPLGLGVAPLGNLYAPVSETDANGTLASAESNNIRLFDVAPLYGYGLAEERLGRYLRHLPSKRRIISTKVGRVLESVRSPPDDPHFVAPLSYRPVFDYSRAGIKRSYEQSLIRLGLERVDILLLHDVDRITHTVGHRALVKMLLDEALPTLQRLKGEGRVTAIGLGINEWDVGYEILTSAEIDCVLLAGRFTLLDQTAFFSGFLDACARQRVSVLAGGVFNSGFLAGGANYNYKTADESLVHKREQINSRCQEYGVPLPAAALQFTASHPAITSVIVGARNASEVNSLITSSSVKIPADLWDRLRTDGLIPAETPYLDNVRSPYVFQ
jgi:D-threo-aldose 1-dehydrogenase